MARTAAIGEQDFSRIIENRYFYIDKTDFIKEWWENGDSVTLITRPRRFGKTLTMSMLDHFFSVRHAGRSDLFEKLHIWKEEKYRKLQGTYPVILLSFANVKGSDYKTVREQICQMIAELYLDYHYILESGLLEKEAEFFEKMSADMSDASAFLSLGQLSKYLYKYYGKKAVILLDEYDTPMQEAYINGYWKELTPFIRGLFHSAFKTNPYLEREILTGITRISKESVFSDLNNLTVVTTAVKLYETAFGFTEDEVFRALGEYGLQGEMAKVKHWYDGFRFGDHDSIYNPWSIIHYLRFKSLKAYWANTSSNRLIGKLIQEGSRDIKTIVEDLLRGKSFYTAVDDQSVFHELDYSQDAVWSLLLASGYLKITGCRIKEPEMGDEGLEYQLALTNLESVWIFKKMIRDWFGVCSPDYNDLIRALLAGDIKSMNAYMNRVALAVVSFFDSGNKPSARTEPERFYHGFVLGLMVDLDNRYVITSNRESGFGRYDVLLKPRSSQDDAIIFEFKVFDEKEEAGLENTAAAAVRQIIEKNYAAALESECSKDKIRIYGFAFRGKEVLIQGGYLDMYENAAVMEANT